MDQKVLIAIIAVIVVIIVIAVVMIMRKRKSQELRQHFGNEYDRAVQKHGSPEKAEAELAGREARVHKFSIRSLPADQRESYVKEWSAVQRRFVDDPATAVGQADALTNQVMAARGYPISDFEQRAADLSVSYPGVVTNYRAARDIMGRHTRGESSTEDLRQAMVHYRSLFDELLETKHA